MDRVVAARRVAPEGTVIGGDIVEAMRAKGRRHAAALGLGTRECRLGHADAFPVPTASVDVMSTHGVFTLCVEKPRVIADMARVLRPGGRLQMADSLLEEHVTPEQRAGMGTWSG